MTQSPALTREWLAGACSMGCGTAIFECNGLILGEKVYRSHFGQKKD